MNQQLDIQKNNTNKTIKKFSENMAVKYIKIQPIKTGNLSQRKKTKILIPTPFTKKRQKFNNNYPFSSNISLINSRKDDSKNETNNTIGDITTNILNNNNIKKKLLLQGDKIKIQKHSINQSITPNGSNKKIKIKIYKVPKQIPKSNDGNLFKIIDIKKIKSMKRKVKNIFNLNTNKNNMTAINISKNDKSKEKELSLINNYNIMQKENLKILSNYLDKLMINRIESKSENHGINNYNENKCKIDSTVENAYYEQDFNFKNRKCNTNIYRKKLKRKINNLNNSFSGLDYPNIIPKIKLINLNKSQFINQKNCNDSNINNLLTNRKKKFIFKRNLCPNENNLHFTPSNRTRSAKNNINDTYGLINLKINRKNTNPNINNNIININHNYLTVARPSKQDINIENNNLNTNNTENTFNFINPDSKRIETMISNNNNLDIKFKKKYLFNMQKDIKNNINSTLFEDGSITPDNEYSLNLNYFSNNNATLTNKWTNLYSNMSSQYNTINTLNNSENNIFKTNNNLSFKGKNNLINVPPIKANKKIYYFNINNKNKLSKVNSLNSKTKIYIKNSLIKKNIKSIIFQNSKDKKLRNIITSIEYCKNNNNNNNKSHNSTKKNVILSEVSCSGKIDIRIKEMENSIEKVIKGNLININNNKSNNKFDLPLPKKWDDDLTYIKKNQGTHLKKIKKHKTVKCFKSHYYPAPVPFK